MPRRKSTCVPFGKRVHFSKTILELIRSDVRDPMRTNSRAGARFFATSIDDYNRWCHVYFMRTKSEVCEQFVGFKNLVENQTGRRIEALQSDNGREYCNEKMAAVLKKVGIEHRLTAPYTSQQNGITERKKTGLSFNSAYRHLFGQRRSIMRTTFRTGASLGV